MSLTSGTRLGPYEILAPLGAGGMGEVYRARDPKLNRDVAVKVLPEHLSSDRSALERLEREARTLASTSHPNILSIFDFGTANGVTYAVMELLDGETLAGLLTHGPLPARKAIEYAVQIADGLGAAHERGIVHRDLKPDNLFVTRDGRLKILDFGLARQQVVLSADDATGVAGGTEPGTILGTVGYMSPEQVRGKVADARSDIFSFGAVLYEMLSGHRAFKGDSAAETLHAILRDDPPGLADAAKSLPPGVDRIVAHCLEKSPDERFQSARDVAFNLKSVGTLTDSNRSGAVAPLRRVDTRRVLAYALLVGVGVAAGWIAAVTLKKPPAIVSPVYQRLTFDRGTIGQARFAPDGQTIVYSAAWRGEPSEVFTTRIDSRESRPLGLGHAALAAVSSTSELALAMDTDWTYGTQITLGRVPLAGGATRGLIENGSYADWSADGSSLVVVRIAGAEERVEFPIGRAIYRTSAVLTHLRVSPRGDLIAFAEHPTEFGATRGSLVVMDQTGTKRVLSKGWDDLWGIAWRPDGREVWFTASLGPREYKSLRAVTLDGQERLVARMPGQVDLQDISKDGRVLVTRPDFRIELIGGGGSSERALTWLGESLLNDLSLDGRQVLFSEAELAGGRGDSVYLRRTDGSPAVRLGEGQGLALSPDGKWALALTADLAHLLALPTGAGEITDLTRTGFGYGFQLPVGLASWGTWLPDSRRVIFNGTFKGGPVRLFVQDLAGGDPKPIGPPGLLGQVVSPDGRSIVAAPWGEALMRYSLDGASPTPLKGVEKGEHAIRWSADGHSLFVASTDGLVSQITAVDLTTGHRKPLWHITPADPAGASPAFGVAVSGDGRSYAYTFFRNISDMYLIDGLR